MTWGDAELSTVIKTLAVVCEVTGTVLSPAAQDLVVRALQAYPAAHVLGALNRCASECKFKLTLADIVSRLDDGRPGAEEAWAMFPKDEADSGVVTQEMSTAWGAADPLYRDGDPIAARMAFKEVYERECRERRQRAIAPVWQVSAGHDRKLLESVAVEAVKAGKLPPSAIEPYVLPERRPVTLKALPAPVLLGDKQLEENKRRLTALLARIENGSPQSEEPALPQAPHWSEPAEVE